MLMMNIAFVNIRQVWLLLSFFLFPFFGYSQKKTLTLSTDSLEASAQLVFHIDSLRNAGHLEAFFDSWRPMDPDSNYQARIHIGPLYKWLQLDARKLPDELRYSVEKRAPLSQAVQLADWLSIQDQILRYAENHGYPFAQVRLQPVISAERAITAMIDFVPGQQILLDSLIVIGNTKIDPFYLRAYLGLEPGQPFSQAQLEDADRKLNNLLFLKRDKATDLHFRDNRVSPIFYLSNKKASRFDFIIGVLPNSQQNSRLLVTADLEAEFQNAFGKGERVFAKFEQLRPATQELQIAVDYPYLLRLPFGSSLDFQLHKRDSTFLDVEWEIGLQYLLGGGNQIQFFWRQEQSRLLAINTTQLEQSQSLPDQLDLRQTLFGIDYQWQNLDYRFNPRRGWAIHTRLGLGNKRILRNVEIEELGLGSLYDDLNTKPLQYRLEVSAAKHWPLFQNSTIRLATNSGLILSNATIYQNEQFRLGGNQLLRGFDEEFFFASRYSVNTLEYRLLISQNSYLFSFLDVGWLGNPNGDQYPLGFGAGISLETSGGLFGVSLAYGKTGEAAIDFTSPKVHFGYVSLF